MLVSGFYKKKPRKSQLKMAEKTQAIIHKKPPNPEKSKVENW